MRGLDAEEGKRQIARSSAASSEAHAQPAESKAAEVEHGRITAIRGYALSALASAAAAALLLYGAYRRGMFYDTSFYKLELILFAACAYIGIMLLTGMFRIGGENTRLAAKLENPLSSAWLWLLLLATLYAARLFAGPPPASMLGTVHESLRYASFGCWAMLLHAWQACDPCRFRVGLLAAVQAAASLLVLGSLAGWFGWLRFPFIVMVSTDERLSAIGARLAGFFQYANMHGAAIAAVLLLQLLLLSRAASLREAWLPVLLAAPAGIVLLLTESRGSWIALAAGMIAAAALAGRDRPRWLLHGAWTAAISAVGYAIAVRIAAGTWLPSSDGFPSLSADQGTVIAVAATLFAAAVGHAMLLRSAGRLRKPAGNRVRIAAYALAAAAFAGCFAIVGNVAGGRVGGHYETASARGLFYADGWRLFMESPLFGHGGDAWRALFQSVQSEPYVGGEVHSGYLDAALDLGMLGLLVLLLMLAAVMLRIWQHDRAGLAPLLVLVLHAAIDFDMSYAFYWLLLLALGALFGAPKPIAGSAPSAAATAAAAGARKRRAGMRIAAAVLAAAMLLTAAGTAWRLELAAAARREAAAAQDGAARALALREALAANPAWTRIRLELAPLAAPGERAALLAAGLRYEPQSAPLHWALGVHYAELGDGRRAAAAMRLALARDRFDKAKQTEAVTTLARLAAALRAGGRSLEARRTAEAALAIFADYDALVRGLSPRAANGRGFRMTDEARQAAESLRVPPESGVDAGQPEPSLSK